MGINLDTPPDVSAGGAGGGAPPRQFAVWVAQRGGQRSNKCSGVEVLSHGNATASAPASFQDNGGGGGQGVWGGGVWDHR